MRIDNLLRNVAGLLTAKLKRKFRVEFEKEVKTEREVRDLLRSFNVVSAEQKAKYSWVVHIRSGKTVQEIIDALEKRNTILKVTDESSN